MSTAGGIARRAPAPRELFAGLVDDAALFPPGNAPMPVAVREHLALRETWYADIVGPFLCPASRVAQLRSCLPDGASLSLSLVVDATGDVPHETAHAALREITADPRLRLVMVEAPAALLGEQAAAVGANLVRLRHAGQDARGFLEVPPTGWDDALALVVAGRGTGGWYAAKYRTGGTRAEAFPSAAALAAFLVAAVAREVPVKLTAGLHHAVRHRDPATGFEHHGLLNVLLAVREAQQGAGADTVADVLARQDSEELAAQARRLRAAEAAGVRETLRSFGCCGVTEPIDDLVALGLLEQDRAVAARPQAAP